MTEGNLLLRNIGLLVTNTGDGPDRLGTIPGAAVVVRGGRIAWTGPERELSPGSEPMAELDCGGGAVLPGFVDSHTHLVYAGDRGDEFGRRLRGETYEEIMAAGGGIQSTVTATRAAAPLALEELAAGRAGRMLAAGTTTVEAKSGYGLDVATEVRLLTVAARVGERLPIDVLPTFLGAHAVPPEFAGDQSGYVSFVIEEMLPACAPHATFCDVFCDEGVFTVAEARAVLNAGKRFGLLPRIHAEQLAHSGGARLAAEVGAVSADHLDQVDASDRQALRAAGTVAVILPGVSFSMQLPQPDARALWDDGVTVAIATDCNPGTSNIETMPFVIALACLEMGLSPEQAVWSATRGGALALGAVDRGIIRTGSPGDLVVLDAPSHIHLAYRPDADIVAAVIKNGVAVS